MPLGRTRTNDELHPKITGTVVVKGAPPTLTLASSTGYSIAGDEVRLTGVVSNRPRRALPAMSVNEAGAGYLGATTTPLIWHQK